MQPSAGEAAVPRVKGKAIGKQPSAGEAAVPSLRAETKRAGQPRERGEANNTQPGAGQRRHEHESRFGAVAPHATQ